MIRSFRLRLTAWYLGFFAVLFALFSVFLYGVFTRGLRDRLDETLHAEVTTAAGLFADELEELKGDVPQAAAEAAAGMRVEGTVVALFAYDRLLASSASSRAEAALVPPPARLPSPGVVTELPTYGAHGIRAVTRVETAGNRRITVLVLAPLDSIAAELRMVRRILFLALPLLLGLAAIGGYMVASRSLAPLAWMAAQAREITGSSLHKRLDIGAAAEELATLAASFNELLSRLDQSFETMRRFVADASHELRTPLSVIRGEADVTLGRERTSAEYKASLGIILDESRRLSRLVDDLLNLARADSGRVRLQIRDFYFNDLLEECCRSAQSLASARGVAMDCRPGEDAPFRGDEELLRRAVMNLLDNAIRYTPAGGKVTAVLETGEQVLRIRISDTGPGIAAEAAPHVFERFYRADEARSRDSGGFGLGLAIVKWVAESHHGAVELATEPGAGTCFTVSLPR